MDICAKQEIYQTIQVIEFWFTKKGNSALAELVKSENPTKLGDYKQSLKVCAYNLDKSNRIIYSVDFVNNTIELRRVGSHKQVYGKD